MTDPKHGAACPDPSGPDSVVPLQDGFRKVYFGEIADPLVSPHPAPPEAEEDDLERAAMEDTAKPFVDMPEAVPTMWRGVFLVLVAAAALAFVFWRR